MRTSAIIEGMTILEKYRNEPDGHNCDAEHDAIYVYPTDKLVEEVDLNRLVELGWFQEDVDCGDEDFTAKHYQAGCCWVCYV